MNVHDLRDSFVTEVLPGAGLPHDARLEPKDETIAEVQCLVVQSRQLSPDLGAGELIMALGATLRQLLVTPNAAQAIGIAALALRLREEHLL